MCVVCGSGEEDAEHMALLCPFARSCWFSTDLGLRTDCLPQSIQETPIWMIKQLTEEDWSSFITCCWAIWRSRNDCVFQEKMLGR